MLAPKVPVKNKLGFCLGFQRGNVFYSPWSRGILHFWAMVRNVRTSLARFWLSLK